MFKPEHPILIAGAGPTGLFLAYALVRQGARVRLIDRKSGPADESRAMGVQARTLEFYRQFGIADAVVSRGIQATTAQLKVNGREKLNFSLEAMGEGLSAFPYMLVFAQDDHERFLIDRLSEHGVVPEWETELVSLEQDADTVHVTLRTPSGELETTADYVVGCDGAGSAVRESLGIGFGGGTSKGLFYVADVDIADSTNDIHVGMAEEALALKLPVRSTGAQRLIGTVSKDVEDKPKVEFSDVEEEAVRLLGVTVQQVHWFSTYHVHHRVAEHFQRGRCFLAGDAGHIHSPVGGQGMNTGLGDAMNLAWKLAAVTQGRAAPSLLDTYEPERITLARQLISTTDQAFQTLTRPGWLSRFLRIHVMPNVVGLATGFSWTRPLLFRTISQIRIDYPNSALSRGKAGGVAAGDRLPWSPTLDTHAPLNELDWSLFIFGDADPELIEAAARHGFIVNEWPWTLSAAEAGFAQNAAYLVRPDGHVGLALPDQDAGAFEAYVSAFGLKPVSAGAPPAPARLIA